MASLHHIVQMTWPEAVHFWLPAVPYVAMIFTLIATLALFAALKNEVQKAFQRERKYLDRECRRMNESLEKVSDTVTAVAAAQESSTPADPVFVPVAVPAGFPSAGFNINRRVQALRLLRRGEDVQHIAAALAVPRREIELLIRVQQITAQASDRVRQTRQENGPTTVIADFERVVPAAPPAATANARPSTLEAQIADRLRKRGTRPARESAATIIAEPALSKLAADLFGSQDSQPEREAITVPQFPTILEPTPTVRHMAVSPEMAAARGSLRRRRVAALA